MLHAHAHAHARAHAHVHAHVSGPCLDSAALPPQAQLVCDLSILLRVFSFLLLPSSSSPLSLIFSSSSFLLLFLGLEKRVLSILYNKSLQATLKRSLLSLHTCAGADTPFIGALGGAVFLFS